MELQRITKQNIVKTTGRSMAELLVKPPCENCDLKILKRQSDPGDIDLLVRGNPQLTLGLTTPIESVDAYFGRKIRKNTCEDKNDDAGYI